MSHSSEKGRENTQRPGGVSQSEEAGLSSFLGVVGFFRQPHSLVRATEKARDAGYHLDAYTPFPVHGLDAAQGLKRSPLPLITFAAGLTGASCGFLLEYWTSVIDWPINVSGKPFNSWPAFVPVMFECTILFAGLATVFGMFFLNRLPNMRRKILDRSLTNHRFALCLEATPGSESGFDRKAAAQFLQAQGAEDVRECFEEGWF